MLNTQHYETMSLLSVFHATEKALVAFWIIYFAVKLIESKTRYILYFPLCRIRIFHWTYFPKQATLMQE
jgi:hypothetical protein